MIFTPEGCFSSKIHAFKDFISALILLFKDISQGLNPIYVRIYEGYCVNYLGESRFHSCPAAMVEYNYE